jgi:GT2 family glycosyltransferase
VGRDVAQDCVAVVPAWRAAATIERTLASLADAGLARAVVVASDEATAERAQAFAAGSPSFDVLVERTGGRLTAGAARNRGRWQAGRPSFLLFVDADVAIAPDCVTRLLEAARSEELAAAAAAILCEGRHPVARARHLLEFKEASALRPPPRDWRLPSTCLLVATGAFDAVGGFPDAWPGEDLVFDAALAGLGARRRLVPDARAVHRHPEGLAEFFRHQRRLGATSAWARRKVAGRGSLAVRQPWLAPLLWPARVLRTVAWGIAGGPRAFLEVATLAPLWMAGLLVWTAAFAGEARRPAPASAPAAESGARAAVAG